jgi:putative oxidoreductase
MAAKRWAATVGGSPEQFGIALVRIMVGIVFVMHGYQKWFTNGPTNTVNMFSSMGIPPAGAYAAMIAELGCGALLVLGLFTRLAAIPIVVTMAVAVIKVHLPNGFFLYPKMGFEYALTLGVAALGIVLAGPGAPAADNLLSGKR